MYLNFQSRSAFSLIESAIILGILGLVIGGIWLAAAQVREQNRVTTVANAILFAAQSRGLYPRESYPTTPSTGVNVTQTSVRAGLLPGAQLIASNQEALLPVGVSLRTALSCYSNCPVFNVTMNGPSIPSKQSRVSGAECKQIIRRFAGLAKNGTDMIYVQISVDGNSNHQFLYPPINGATVDCPDNFDYVVFWFRAA